MSRTIKVEEIEREILSKTPNQLYDLMWSALDYMQQYAGRDKFECIAHSLGYGKTIDDNGNIIYYYI